MCRLRKGDIPHVVVEGLHTKVLDEGLACVLKERVCGVSRRPSVILRLRYSGRYLKASTEKGQAAD